MGLGNEEVVEIHASGAEVQLDRAGENGVADEGALHFSHECLGPWVRADKVASQAVKAGLGRVAMVPGKGLNHGQKGGKIVGGCKDGIAGDPMTKPPRGGLGVL